MAISSATGNIEHNTQDVFGEMEANAKNVSEGIGGKVDATTEVEGALWWKTGGDAFVDFAGMDGKNIAKFGMAMGKYISNVQDIISGLNRKQEVTQGAFKGSVAESLNTFFNSMRELLMSYNAALEIETKRVIEANENWLKATSSMSSDIDADSSNVSKAQISLEN